MPKMKTHKGTAKVCNIKKGKNISITKAGKNHKTGAKNASYNRSKRTAGTLSSGDYKRLKNVL